MEQIDPELLCPATKKICPGKRDIAELFIGNESQVDHDTATADRIGYDREIRRYDSGEKAAACRALAVTVEAPETRLAM